MGCLFTLLIIYPLIHTSFYFSEVHFSCFYYLCLWCHMEEVSATSSVVKLCCFLFLCSVKSFSFSSHIWVFDPVWVNFCIWYELGSIFILLHVDVQFSHHHLLKRLSFPHWMVFTHLLKIMWPFMWRFVSGVSILLFACTSVRMLVPHLWLL